MSESVAERRAEPRVSAEFQLQGTPSDGGVVARMVANNLSLGGLYCTSTTDFPEMTRLAVRLLLPLPGKANTDTEPVDLQAVVVRRTKVRSSNSDPRFELALFFTELAEETRERLRRFLDR